MKYTIAFPAGLTAAVLLLCTGCAATQVRDRAYLQAIELRSPDTPTVLLHDFHESKADLRNSLYFSTARGALRQLPTPPFR